MRPKYSMVTISPPMRVNLAPTFGTSSFAGLVYDAPLIDILSMKPLS